MARTVKAIKVSDWDDRTSYLILGAHAGRGKQTGQKVHLIYATFYKATGKLIGESTACSSSGHLKASIITDPRYDFSHVTCKNCGGGNAELAERRNANAIDLKVLGGNNGQDSPPQFV